MSYDELRSDGSRHRQLSGLIEGLDVLLDTPCDLSDNRQMVRIGRSLFIPETVWAYRIPVAPDIFIDSVEIRYSEEQGDFVVCRMDLDATNRDRQPADITSAILSKMAMDRIKRTVLSRWILIDHGAGREMRRWQTWNDYLDRNPRMFGGRGGAAALHHVAEFHAAAKYSDCDARELIADRFDVSRATASRWITKAKEQGYIKS